MSNPTITFLGAAGTVTGSRFLLQAQGSSVLIDCGMFQGKREVEALNRSLPSIDITNLAAVVLTHAHLDHCGFLPVLIKEGFKGPIYATHYTKELAGLVLRDSAHLQMDDAKYNEEPGLYNLDDVEKTLEKFKDCEFRTSIKINEEFSVTFYPAGHILGSSFIVVDVAGKKLLFTGDMGRSNHPLLAAPDSAPINGIDAVISESTYGDRIHETPVELFAHEINAALKRGGQILIPAFAIDRTEVILMALRELIEKKVIPAIPIYIDSPMAISALNYYREAVRDNVVGIKDGVSQRWANQDPFDAGALFQAFTTEESKRLNENEGPSILISASGMASGGRVVHHLAFMLPEPKNTVILVGFQAYGTRGRQLLEGATRVKIHGDWVNVAAHIANVESFSVHADGDELVDWLKPINKPSHLYLVHGEPESQMTFKTRLVKDLGWDVIVPTSGESFTL